MSEDWREKAKAHINNVSVKAEPIERDAWLVKALAALEKTEKHDWECIAALERQGSEIVGLRHDLAANREVVKKAANERCANRFPMTPPSGDCGSCVSCLARKLCK